MKILFFILFFGFMVIKIPIAFAMLASSLCYVLMRGESLMMITQRMLAACLNFPLLAVGFFLLAGNIMNRGGITEKLFGFCRILVGWIPGGMGHANVIASVVFAGMSGAAVADAGGLGLIELKAMKDAGYDDDFSLSVTAASSIIGPIIPPSIPAVLFAVVSGVSVGRLFVGGIVPGVLIALLECAIVFYYAKRRNYPMDPKPNLKEIWTSFKFAFFPMMTPIIIIGGMACSVFTPTEASVAAVVYALILGVVTKELKVSELPEIMFDTIKSTVTILFISGCANIFGYIINTMQIAPAIANWFMTYINNPTIAMLLLFVFLLFVGCFMDNGAAIMILVPVLMPIAVNLHIDLVYFGVIFILSIMLGLITPPVGLVLFVLSNISDVPFTRVAKATLPYVIGVALMILLLIFCEPLVTFLPNLMFNA